MHTEPCATLPFGVGPHMQPTPHVAPHVPLHSATRKSHRGAGDDARLLPRHRATETPSLDRRRLERAQAAVILDSLTTSDEPLPLKHELTKPGDADQLRGIPAIGRSVAGAIPGSNPETETIARLMRAEKLKQATTFFKPRIAA